MDAAALVYHREAFLAGQWWLPFTAQVAHFNTPHALANLAAAVLLFLLFRSFLRWQQQALVLAGGILGVALVVVLDVHCSYYAGASGALYGWAAGGAVLVWRTQPDSRSRTLAVLLMLGIFAKLLAATWGLDTLVAWGFPVYGPAHGAGALGGGVFALLVRRGVAHRRTGQQHQQGRE
jgi:rhomboid family GlyGly-CTERM serine protease